MTINYHMKDARTLRILAMGFAGVPAIEAARRERVSRAWTSLLYQQAGIRTQPLRHVGICAACHTPTEPRLRFCSDECERSARRDVQPDGSRPCRRCGEVKPERAFPRYSSSECRTCCTSRTIAWRKAHPKPA